MDHKNIWITKKYGITDNTYGITEKTYGFQKNIWVAEKYIKNVLNQKKKTYRKDMELKKKNIHKT